VTRSSDHSEPPQVRISVRVPCVGDAVRDPGITQIAPWSEQAGVDGIWVNDHLVMPSHIRSPYPFDDTGTAWWSPDAPWHEAFVSASFAGACTTSCEIGIATLVLPQRNLITVSKMASTLDVLTRGRFILGVGAGWLAEEMLALGYDFDSRGKRLEAMIPVLRDTWSGRPQGVSSEHLSLTPGLIFEPTPTRSGGPPIMVGGDSNAALRRAAQLGDGWLGFVAGHRFDIRRLAAQVELIRELRADGPRSGQPFRVVACMVTDQAAKSRLPEIAEELAGVGFDEVAIDPPWNDIDTAMELVERTIATLGLRNGGTRLGPGVRPRDEDKRSVDGRPT
jgi:probable F420-dependent oxidoreductase